MSEKPGKLPFIEPVVFISLTVVLTLLLVGTALIPKEAIRKNMAESAELLCERKIIFEVIPGIESSKLDRYADSILLGIAWQYDSADPFGSVMRSAYYSSEVENENEDLKRAVLEDIPSNKEYLRYWHGSIALVRPLLALIPLKGIYILNALVLLILAGILFWMLIRRKWYVLAIGLFIGLVAVSAWFVPFCLEYTWVFLLTFIFSIAAVKVAESRYYRSFGLMFMIFGMLTVYFDFLTTETLTLTVPLIVFLWARSKRAEDKASDKSDIYIAVRSALSWGVGYLGFWCMKWVIASAVLGENVLPLVTGHVNERISGRVYSLEGNTGFVDLIPGSLIRNVGNLLPFGFGLVGMIAGVLIFITYCYVIFVYRRDNRDRKKTLTYFAIALIPFLRYIVLHNHGYLHSSFTYRALLGTILAMAVILYEMVRPGTK